MCVTAIDLAACMLEIEKIDTLVRFDKTGTIDEAFNKKSAQISRLFYKAWLNHFPQARYIIYDNGDKFKLHFATL